MIRLLICGEGAGESGDSTFKHTEPTDAEYISHCFTFLLSLLALSHRTRHKNDLSLLIGHRDLLIGFKSSAKSSVSRHGDWPY